MTARVLRRALVGYAALLLLACVALHSYVALGRPAHFTLVESWWREGQRVGRQVRAEADGVSPSAPAGTHVVVEEVTGEGPLSLWPPLFTFSLVPGKDGVKAELGGRTAYATVDDLLAAQAYDRGATFMDASLGLGTHHAVVLHLLAEQLGTSAREVADKARFHRVRFARWGPPVRRVTAANLDRDTVTFAVRDAAHHLAQSVDGSGRYRYLVNAPTNVEVDAYNWPRHAGATLFLAQAAALLDDPDVRYACLRAASRLRDETMTSCGEHRCIADDDVADVGSSALALIAFAEIVRTGADGSYRPAALELAAFLRSLQRPDGELMHLYARSQNKPLDVQFLYYTGEAALALSRAHRITNDPRDLDAASRALRRLAGKGWSFFGSRYFFSEEHWTCQAVADLWDRAPDEEALAFCMRWHEFQRRLQHVEGDSPFDAEGAFGVGPILSPRVTPAASRGEAAIALLDVLLRERAQGRLAHDDHVEPVETELRRALAFVVRHQLRPGPTHLFADPAAVDGAFPGSPVDWQLRIDYAQHAGSMMVRWLELGAEPTHAGHERRLR
jgi:hypothetical protein